VRKNVNTQIYTHQCTLTHSSRDFWLECNWVLLMLRKPKSAHQHMCC